MFLYGYSVLFMGLANTFFSNFFFKIEFHGTIHTFKNYFTIVFSIFSFQFSIISGIQTDPHYLLSKTMLSEMQYLTMNYLKWFFFFFLNEVLVIWDRAVRGYVMGQSILILMGHKLIVKWTLNYWRVERDDDCWPFAFFNRKAKVTFCNCFFYLFFVFKINFLFLRLKKLVWQLKIDRKQKLFSKLNLWRKLKTCK